jgi:cell division protein FtsQ
MAGAGGQAHRQLVRRLFPRRNRRARGAGRTAWPAVRLRAVRLACAAAAVGAVLAAWPRIAPTVRQHPYFAIREVEVSPLRRLTAEAVRTVAAIEPGTSVWDVDCRAVETRLAREPWIRSARVRRQLPHRIVIHVREERPVAIMALDGPTPRLYYVSAHGRVFAPLAADDPRDFPYLTGLSAADVEQGGVLPGRAIRRALTLLRTVATAAPGLGPVSEIHVDAARGLTLLPTRLTMPIEVGWVGFDAKLSRLPEVMKRWEGREDEIVAVSLLFDDEVVVRTRTLKPAPARPDART